MKKPFHCIILSTKSAGSSALQKFLVKDYGFSMIEKTPHHENETLFWTKAASILGLPQLGMHRSKVPYSPEQALESLNQFCEVNGVEGLKSTNITKQDIFKAYHNLVSQHGARFIEKSPHHLYNQSNLDLIKEFIAQYKEEIDFKILGLIRHPLSVIYSGWERWKYDCSQFEKEWFISNSNLLNYQKELNIELVRYEDLVAENGAFMQDILGLEPQSREFKFRSSSLYKWKSDMEFGHRLSEETLQLAENFGYSEFETSNENMSWKIKSLSTFVSEEMKRLWRQQNPFRMKKQGS